MTFNINASLTLTSSATVVTIRVFREVLRDSSITFPNVISPISRANRNNKFATSDEANGGSRTANVFKSIRRVLKGKGLYEVQRPRNSRTSRNDRKAALLMNVSAGSKGAKGKGEGIVVANFRGAKCVTIFHGTMGNTRWVFYLVERRPIAAIRGVAISLFYRKTTYSSGSVESAPINDFYWGFEGENVREFVLLWVRSNNYLITEVQWTLYSVTKSSG